MGWMDRRNELKLDILGSLARSQRALARMLESIADVTDASEATAKAVQDNLKLIAEYQRSVIVKLTYIDPAVNQASRPARPWTNAKLKVASERPEPPSPARKRNG